MLQFDTFAQLNPYVQLLRIWVLDKLSRLENILEMLSDNRPVDAE